MSEIVTAFFVVAGGFFALAAALGVLRLPDVLIRMHASDISVVGRATQGVRVMRVGANEVVTSMERLPKTSETNGPIAAAAPITTDAADTIPHEMELPHDDDTDDDDDDTHDDDE